MTAESPNSQLKWPGRDAIIDTIWEYLIQRRWFPSNLERSQVRVLDYRELEDPNFRLLILEAQGIWYHLPLALVADWNGAGIAGRTSYPKENPGYLVEGPYCPYSIGSDLPTRRALYPYCQKLTICCLTC